MMVDWVRRVEKGFIGQSVDICRLLLQRQATWTSVLKARWWCESAKAVAVCEGCRQQGFLRRPVAAKGAIVVPGEI
jgi:hypothetical protein